MRGLTREHHVQRHRLSRHQGANPSSQGRGQKRVPKGAVIPPGPLELSGKLRILPQAGATRETWPPATGWGEATGSAVSREVRAVLDDPAQVTL